MALIESGGPGPTRRAGNLKVTRADWLAAAKAVLMADGASHVKILPLAERLGVSRSSFYWYFKDRAALLDALLEDWQAKNTAAILRQAALPAPTITAAVINVQKCVLDPDLFETALDFAVRDWGRRSETVRAALRRSDTTRIAALTEMFLRYDYPAREAEIRAFTLYYQQIGYDLADLGHDPAYRLARVPDYLRVFTGREPAAGEITDFEAYARQFWDFGEETT